MQLNGVSLIILWHSDDFYYCNADSIEHSEGVTLTYNLIACSASSKEDLFMERAFTDVKCPHHHHSHRMLQIVMNCLLSSLVVHCKAYSMSFPHVNQSINLLFSTQIQRVRLNVMEKSCVVCDKLKWWWYYRRQVLFMSHDILKNCPHVVCYRLMNGKIQKWL